MGAGRGLNQGGWGARVGSPLPPQNNKAIRLGRGDTRPRAFSKPAAASQRPIGVRNTSVRATQNDIGGKRFGSGANIVTFKD